MTLPGPDEDIKTVRGRTLVLPIVILVALAVGVVSIYKLQEKPGPTMRFERLTAEGAAGNGTDGRPLMTLPLNTTYLPFRPVHDAYFLEDHLHTAIGYGNSSEADPLRVDQMELTLGSLTHRDAPWLVVWDDTLLRVTLSG